MSFGLKKKIAHRLNYINISLRLQFVSFFVRKRNFTLEFLQNKREFNPVFSYKIIEKFIW